MLTRFYSNMKSFISNSKYLIIDTPLVTSVVHLAPTLGVVGNVGFLLLGLRAVVEGVLEWCGWVAGHGEVMRSFFQGGWRRGWRSLLGPASGV